MVKHRICKIIPTTMFLKMQNVKYLSHYKMKYSKQMHMLFINKQQTTSCRNFFLQFSQNVIDNR